MGGGRRGVVGAALMLALVPACASADVYYRADSSLAGTNVVLHVDADHPFNYLSFDPSDNALQLSNAVVTAGNLPCVIHTGAQDIGPYLRCGTGQKEGAISSIEVHFQLSPCCPAIANKLVTFDGNQNTNSTPAPTYTSNVNGPTAEVSSGMPRPPSDNMPRPTDCAVSASAARASVFARGAAINCSTEERIAELRQARDNAANTAAWACFGGIPSGLGIGFLAGAGIGALWGGGVGVAACGVALAAAQAAQDAYAKDPPDPKFREVALPGAAKAPPSVRKSCQALKKSRRSSCEGLAKSYLRAAAASTPFLQAIYVTQNRFGTARDASDQAAMALQDSVLKVYSGKLAGAFDKQKTAGRKFVALLRRVGMKYGLAADQSALALAKLNGSDPFTAEQVAAAQSVHIDLAAVQRIVGLSEGAVKAGRVDILGLLATAPSSVEARRDWRHITLAEVGAVLNALKAQGALKGQTAKALTADYTKATKAKGAKKRRAAVKKLIAHAKAKHTKAGDFVATAATPLGR